MPSSQPKESEPFRSGAQVCAGRLGNLLELDEPGLRPLLAEQAEVLWNTLRWEVEPWMGPMAGLTWISEGQVTGSLPLRLSGDIVIAGRLFASRRGPSEAVEQTLLNAAIGIAWASPLIHCFFGDLPGVTAGTFQWLRARWPDQVQERSFMEVAWDGAGGGSGRSLEPWQGDQLVAASELLLNVYADVPDFPIDPAFKSQEGLAHLLDRIISNPVCGRFEPRASFMARDARGGLQGFVLACRMGPDQGHVAELAVAPGARGQGIGKALAIQALDALRGLGCRATHLTVDRDNAQAARLYDSLGFHEYHRFPTLRLRRSGIMGLPG
jgi:ribosomal protein S18 acetylase RimI-like enzyme